MWERVVSSIVTGLIVGLVLWFFQLKKEKKDLKNNYERELSILKERLCFINYDQNTLSLDSIQQSIPQYIEELIGVLQNYPLDLIEKYVKHNHELATLLLETQNKYLEVINNAKRLDIKINQYIRQYNAGRGAIAANDYRYRIYFIGKVYEANDDEIEPWFDVGNIREDMRKLFDEFKKEHNDLIQNYSKSIEKLYGLVKKIERLVFGFE